MNTFLLVLFFLSKKVICGLLRGTRGRFCLRPCLTPLRSLILSAGGWEFLGLNNNKIRQSCRFYRINSLRRNLEFNGINYIAYIINEFAVHLVFPCFFPKTHFHTDYRGCFMYRYNSLFAKVKLTKADSCGKIMLDDQKYSQ